ncbi:daptide biosynthesis intramembrane metalloprotease [Amycolatopsis sp. cmx-11-12]|uniref:daptide biosynthesis intramembrane metalloprotease n=1 Tax=Amycolatopsis sp. cmx-11-12 TaxID=2785795 RepID=UPI003917C3DF
MTSIDLTHPRLAPWVIVHHPMEDGAPWIVERQGSNPLRVSDDIGALLATIDGERDAQALAAMLGPQWTPDLVTVAVHRFHALGLLTEPGTTGPKPERRFVAVSWMNLQLRLIQAYRVLEPARPMLTRLRGSFVLPATLLVSFVGILALIAQHRIVSATLGEPLPFTSMAVVWLGLGVSTIFHELSHGATLTHYRGRPGWLGIMLFYLTPACFCEVTDGWRLANSRQRVMVAMAGVAAQAVMSSVAALVALVMPNGDGRTMLVGFAMASYLSAIVNLIPWIKLDGYLALMSYLDIPHLREKVIADARGWLDRRLFGIAFTCELPKLRWAVPFGMLCILFPGLVLAAAANRWGYLLLNMGVVGAIARLLLIVFVVYWLARRATLALRNARRGGASYIRITGAALLVGLVLAAPLSLINIHDDVHGGYTRDGSSVRLALPIGTDPSTIRSGDRVWLERRGLVLSTTQGVARVGAAHPVPATVPIETLAPVQADATIDAITLPLEGVSSAQLDTAGGATVPGSAQPLARWLYAQGQSAWNDVFGG